MKLNCFGLLIALVFLVLISGCAPAVFVKDDMSNFQEDAYQCEQLGLSAGAGNMFIARDYEHQCMQRRGYRQQ